MTLPGMPGSQVQNDGDIMRIISDLQRQVRELAAQNVLATAGITTQTNGVTVAGALNVNGDANFTGNTTIGGNTNVTGNITKSNSWGSSSLGPVAFGGGGPGLTFTKAGKTYGAPVGVGMNGDANGEYLSFYGPATSTNGGYFQIGSNNSYSLSADFNGTCASIVANPGSTGSLVLTAGSSNGSVNIWPYGTGKCQVNGNFAVSGSKAFIMAHPLHPDTMELMHAATESPVNGVEYWGTVTLDATGQATATLPAYFEALTKTTGRNIQLTPIGRTAVQVSADPIVDGSFTVYGAPGQEVGWLVKAERQQIVDGYDELSFPVEQYKALIGPQLPDNSTRA